MTPALNQDEPTQQPVIVVESKPPEKVTDKNHYQGVLTTRAGLMSYLEATFTEYGIEDQIPIAIKVIECESSFNINANSGISFGLLQFTRPTWHDFGTGDIWNPHKQIEVTAKIVKREGWGRWDCFTGKR